MKVVNNNHILILENVNQINFKLIEKLLNIIHFNKTCLNFSIKFTNKVKKLI